MNNYEYPGLCMFYKDGYHYQLAANESFKTSFKPEKTISSKRITLYTDGTMIVKEGYAWDGASGIIDRKTNLKASCGHDALYQLMRERLLNHHDWAKADEDFCRWLKEAGAWSMTVSIDRSGLKLFGGKYAHPKNIKKIHMV